MIEPEKKVDSPTVSSPAANPANGIRINFHLPIRKKILLWVVLPVVVVGLLIFGLVQQGFVAEWLDAYNKATATITVVDKENKPIDSARVVFAETFGTTDTAGIATVADLVSGEQEMSVQKTGFISYKQTVTLKRGGNDLGNIVLDEVPTPKVTLGISITNYVSEENLDSVTIKLGDIVGAFDSGKYTISDVPVGKHKLVVSREGFASFNSEVTVEEKTTSLDTVKLVPVGTAVFESNRDGGKRGIFTANYDGSDQKNLVARVGDYEDFTPTLGPNQHKLFFTSTRDGLKRENSADLRNFLYVVDIDGSNLTKISETSSGYTTWSPDGGFIGYTKYTDDYSRSEIYTYDVVRKTSHEFSDYNSSSFQFSRDGKLVAFAGNKVGQLERRLVLAKSDATDIAEILVATNPNDYFSSPEFTTTNKLRYTRYDSTTQKTKWYEYDLSTKVATEITAPATDREGATLSPDKKYRAYASTRDGKTNIYLSDPDGKNEKKITELNRVVGDILWSKDSSFVMFSYRSEGESARYLVSVNGKAKAKKIVDINLTYYY